MSTETAKLQTSSDELIPCPVDHQCEGEQSCGCWCDLHDVPIAECPTFRLVDSWTEQLRAERDALTAAIAQAREALTAALTAWTPEHEYHRDRAERKGYSHDETAAEVYGHAIKVVTAALAALDTPTAPEMRPVSVESPGNDGFRYVPDVTASSKEAPAKVPDRIDYDDDGELNDVVINDCMAHLERLDVGLWYLGLYGKDGRIVQIDIGSKTGRAEVIGTVKYREGIAPDLRRWAKAAPETPGDAEEATDG